MVFAPETQFFFLGAYNATLAQFLVTGNLPVRELPILTEYDIEAHSEDAEAHYCYGKEEYFHLETLEIRKQRLAGHGEHRRHLHHLERGSVAQTYDTLHQRLVNP